MHRHHGERAHSTAHANAACESFHSSLKRELLKGARRFDGPANCRQVVFRWLNRYNSWRRHSTNGQVCPIEYERQHELPSDTVDLAA
ncbi:integrase core domain-containing protein [Streptomyces sp. NPDC048496]|uniref:integrase core domain-containing protein n=1 Tax=Streptomyces sp. NPDC048496 TaxID=3365558 RepID=UPI00371F9A32